MANGLLGWSQMAYGGLLGPRQKGNPDDQLDNQLNPFDTEHREKTAVKFSILRMVML